MVYKLLFLYVNLYTTKGNLRSENLKYWYKKH
jgi:hypothetical protein